MTPKLALGQLIRVKGFDWRGDYRWRVVDISREDIYTLKSRKGNYHTQEGYLLRAWLRDGKLEICKEG